MSFITNLNIKDGQITALKLDATDTYTLGGLTVNGDTFIANGNGMVIGHGSQLSVIGLTTEFQVLGTSQSDGSIVVGVWSADANGTIISGVKSRNATIGSSTIVQDNDIILRLNGIADDGADFTRITSRIQFEVDDASPAENQVGGASVFLTSTTGGVLTEALRIDSSQNINIANGDVFVENGNGMVIGHTSQLLAGFTSEFQVLGTAGADSSIIIGNFGATNQPDLAFLKSRAAIGSFTIVQDNDVLGRIIFRADDGTDYQSYGALMMPQLHQ